MVLAIDAFPLSKHLTGIGRYVFEICRRLDLLMPDTRFILYSPEPLKVPLPSKRWQTRIVGRKLAKSASSYVWLKILAGRLAKVDRADIFWATRSILPAFSSGFHTVSTVHDLNSLLFPSSMPYGTFLAFRIWFKSDMHRADRIVTVSQGTSYRLQNLVGIGAPAVAKPGISECFRRQDPQLVQQRLERLAVHQPYFFAVGTLEPRKNMRTLLEAFISLKREALLSDHTLLIAGGRGWRNQKVLNLLRESETAGIRWLGYVVDEDLAALYSGAEAFIFPSVYEGFGIPALEARACGARIIASDLPELRESAGQNALFVQPTVAGLRAGLLRARQIQPEQSFQELEFSWEEAARTMETIFRKMYENR